MVGAALTTMVSALGAGSAMAADQAGPSAGGPASTTSSRSDAQPTGIPQLATVVVTAEKRSERLQEVPMSVTAIDSKALLQNNLVRLQDYSNTIPSLNIITNEYGAPTASIRGLTTGGSSDPTVGIVIDDVPYGSPSHLNSGQEVLDLDPSDLSGLEVLRGPQGTLYGASSLGGLIKYETANPSTAGVSGSIQTGASAIDHGGVGAMVRGSVNLPVNDQFAVRASAFYRTDPGYVDNILTGQRDVNDGNAEGIFVTGLWRPNDTSSLKLTALVQEEDRNGSSFVTTGLGDLQQNFSAKSGVRKNLAQFYSAVFKTRFEGVDFTSITGFNAGTLTKGLDYTNALGKLTLAQFGQSGTTLALKTNINVFTEEMRFSGTLWSRLDWLAGGFYENEDTSQAQEDIWAVVPASGQIVGQWGAFLYPSRFEEYAVFGNLTYHFTEKFDVQLGGREGHNNQSLSETISGPYDTVFLRAASPVVYPKTTSSADAFTYLVSPRYKVSDDLMVYARVASGYRPGGPNYNVGGVPLQYGADTTTNYEVGVKASAFDKKLTFDLSAYYIDWQKVQLSLVSSSTNQQYTANGNSAKSQGVELSAEANPLQGLRLSGWIAYNDAELAQSMPAASAAYGPSGSRLPFATRLTGNMSAEQSFPLAGEWSGFVGGDVSYVGSRVGLFTRTAVRQVYPEYWTENLRAGVRYRTWSVTAFANNVGDSRGVLNGGLGTLVANGFQLVTPRTVGFTLGETF